MDAGIAPGEKQKDNPEFSVVRDFTRAEAIRNFAFWIYNGIFALQALFITGYVFHVLDLAQQLGISKNVSWAFFCQDNWRRDKHRRRLV